jgi:hypothetical protein
MVGLGAILSMAEIGVEAVAVHIPVVAVAHTIEVGNLTRPLIFIDLLQSMAVTFREVGSRTTLAEADSKNTMQETTRYLCEGQHPFALPLGLPLPLRHLRLARTPKQKRLRLRLRLQLQQPTSWISSTMITQLVFQLSVQTRPCRLSKLSRTMVRFDFYQRPR